MAEYTTVTSQLLKHISRSAFQAIVERWRGDKRVRTLSCWSQFVALFFGQLTGQQSLRDVVTAVNTGLGKLGALGVGRVERSTLADANAGRDHRIYEELFYWLYGRCRAVAPGHGFRFRHKLYSLDATVITLCLKVFRWAPYSRRKGGIKAHLAIDHDGLIPSFCVVRPGKEHEIEVARRQRWEPDSILTFDRGYVDYRWFHELGGQGVWFVTRLKRNLRYQVLERRPVQHSSGVLSDQLIRFVGKRAARELPETLRRVGYRDAETGQFYEFLTNIEHLAAAEITAIYKARWQVELFFKWIKQHLRVKTFIGTSRNAVMTQIWVALCVYLLVAYMKFRSRSKFSLYELLKRFQVAALEYLKVDALLLNMSLGGEKRRERARAAPQLFPAIPTKGNSITCGLTA